MDRETLPKGERTRRIILEAAYSLFISQGYAATSMRQIADRAGVALGSLYTHFASKEDMFGAIVQEQHPFFQVLPTLSSVPGENIEDFVRNAAHTLVDQLGQYPDFLNLMLTEIVEFKGQHVPLLFGRFLPMAMPLVRRIGDLDGHVRPIPPVVLARAFLGMFFSYYITGVLLGNALPAETQADALDHFVDIFLHGILLKEIS